MGKEKRRSGNGRGTKHPKYIGVRKRKWGLWVSEIRELKKKSRIWLGSFPTPEMAARARDAATLALRDPSANFNLPEAIHSLPLPFPNFSPKNIRAAAVEAAYDQTPPTLLLHERKELPQQLSSLRSYNKNNMDNEYVESKLPSCAESIDIRGDYNGEDVDWLDLPNWVMNIADGLSMGSWLLHHSSSISEEEQDGHVFISLWDFT